MAEATSTMYSKNLVIFNEQIISKAVLISTYLKMDETFASSLI